MPRKSTYVVVLGAFEKHRILVGPVVDVDENIFCATIFDESGSKL